MFATMRIYQNFHVQTYEMFTDRVIDFSKGIERVGKIMSQFPNFNEEKWNQARQECDKEWHHGIEIEDEVKGLTALQF